MEQTQFYTVAEIARMFRVTENSVRRWITRGKLKGWKAGLEWRFTKEDLDKFIKEHSNANAK